MAQNAIPNGGAEYRYETQEYDENQVSESILEGINRYSPSLCKELEIQEMREIKRLSQGLDQEENDTDHRTDSLPSWFQGENAQQNAQALFDSFQENTANLDPEDVRQLAHKYAEVISRQLAVKDATGGLQTMVNGQTDIGECIANGDMVNYQKTMESMGGLPQETDKKESQQTNGLQAAGKTAADAIALTADVATLAQQAPAFY